MILRTGQISAQYRITDQINAFVSHFDRIIDAFLDASSTRSPFNRILYKQKHATLANENRKNEIVTQNHTNMRTETTTITKRKKNTV